MSLTARRCLSWVATLAFAAGVAVGVSRLPGTGGPRAELHWLLRQNQPQGLNRAGLLLYLIREQDPAAHAALITQLLESDDPREVGGVLTIVATTAEPPDAATYSAVLHWFDGSTTEERVQHLPHSLICLARDPCPWPDGHPSWKPKSAGRERADSDPRWLVAATLLRAEPARMLARVLVLPANESANPVDERTDVLDAASSASAMRVEQTTVAPLQFDELALDLTLPIEGLYAMLNDPLPEVRMGAGRILAVAGVRAALPAFGEWLRQENRQLPLAANKMLTDLYGPDWRQLCESRGATSQPGAGDGR